VRAILQFVKTTIVGGMVFLLPLALVLVLLGKAHEATHRIVQPVADLLPFKEVAGFGVAKVAAVLILLLVALIAGLFARSDMGARLAVELEGLLPRRASALTLLRSMTQAGDDRIKVALATVDDAWLFAFIMDEAADGTLTVFVPGAPTPTSGSLYLMTEKQVRRLSIGVREAVECISKLGVGSSALVNPQSTAGRASR